MSFYRHYPRITAERRANDDPETGHLARNRWSTKNLPPRWDPIDRSRRGNKNWKELRGKKYHEQKRIKHCLEIRGKNIRGFFYDIEERYPDAFLQEQLPSINNQTGIMTQRIYWYDIPHGSIIDEVLKGLQEARLQRGYTLRAEMEILDIKYNGKSLEIGQARDYERAEPENQNKADKHTSDVVYVPKNPLAKKFEKMGARLNFSIVPQRCSVNISRDERGQIFDIALDCTEWEAIVLDIQPQQRHLLLLIRDYTGESEAKYKYLCGHDERNWFVAAVPEKSGASNVRMAMEALKPDEVLAAQSQKNVNEKNRNRRRNEAFVRQGEWFFLPEPDLTPVKWMILADEPLMRGRGKPHMAEYLYRTGGTTVYVSRQHPNGLSEENFRRGVKTGQISASDFQVRRLNPRVYVKGRITHPDHKTVLLNDWHRVIPNTENRAAAMPHLAFID